MKTFREIAVGKRLKERRSIIGTLQRRRSMDVYKERYLDPHEEMRAAYDAYNYNSLFQSAVNSLVMFIVGNDLKIVCNDELTRKFLQSHIDNTGLENAMVEVIENTVKSGNGYLEIDFNPINGLPAKYYPIADSSRIYLNANQYGQPFTKRLPDGSVATNAHEFYLQEVDYTYWGREAYWYEISYVFGTRFYNKRIRALPIPKNKLLHFKLNLGDTGIYGRSYLASSIDDDEILKEIERSLAIIAKYKATPRKIIQYGGTGGPNDGSPATDDEKNDFISYLENLEPEENMVVNKKIQVDDWSYSGKDINMGYMIDHIRKKIIAGLAPEFLIGIGDETNRATAKEQLTAFIIQVMSIRKKFLKPLKELIFDKIVEYNNSIGFKLSGDFELEFGELDFEEKQEKVTRVSQMWTNNEITFNEMREELGYSEIGDEGDVYFADWVGKMQQKFQQQMMGGGFGGEEEFTSTEDSPSMGNYDFKKFRKDDEGNQQITTQATPFTKDVDMEGNSEEQNSKPLLDDKHAYDPPIYNDYDDKVREPYHQDPNINTSDEREPGAGDILVRPGEEDELQQIVTQAVGLPGPMPDESSPHNDNDVVQPKPEYPAVGYKDKEAKKVPLAQPGDIVWIKDEDPKLKEAGKTGLKRGKVISVTDSNAFIKVGDENLQITEDMIVKDDNAIQDYFTGMESVTELQMKDVIEDIAQIAHDNDIEMLISGGIVRNKLMREEFDPESDADLTTEKRGDSIELAYLVAEDRNLPRPEIYRASGVAHIKLGGVDIEFRGLRRDIGYVDKYLMSINKPLTSLNEDAYSRDFTFNAVFYDPVGNRFLDPTGQGIRDAKDRIIRTPIPADMLIKRKPAVILRALRFMLQHNARLDEGLEQAIKANPRMLILLTQKGFNHVLPKLLRYGKDAIELMKEYGVLKYIPKRFLKDYSEEELQVMDVDNESKPAVDTSKQFPAVTDFKEPVTAYAKEGGPMSNKAKHILDDFEQGNRDQKNRDMSKLASDIQKKNNITPHNHPETPTSALKKVLDTRETMPGPSIADQMGKDWPIKYKKNEKFSESTKVKPQYKESFNERFNRITALKEKKVILKDNEPGKLVNLKCREGCCSSEDFKEKMTEAPGYHMTDDMHKWCSVCAFYDDSKQWCNRYRFEAEPDYTCNSFTPETAQERFVEKMNKAKLEFPHNPSGTKYIDEKFGVELRKVFNEARNKVLNNIDKHKVTYQESIRTEANLGPGFKEFVETVILSMGPKLREVLKKFISQSMMKGINDAQITMKLGAVRPPTKDNIQQHVQRSMQNIQGFTNKMRKELDELLSEGISQGDSISTIANSIRQQFKITRSRSKLIARSEVVRTYNESKISAFKEKGLKTGIMLASADDRTCLGHNFNAYNELTGEMYHNCRDWRNKRFNLDKPLIPVISSHPNCRCSVILDREELIKKNDKM